MQETSAFFSGNLAFSICFLKKSRVFNISKAYDNDDKQLVQWNPMKLSNKNLIGYAVIMLKCKIDSFILENKNNKNNEIELEIDYVNKMFVYKSKLAHNASHYRYIYWKYFLQKKYVI